MNTQNGAGTTKVGRVCPSALYSQRPRTARRDRRALPLISGLSACLRFPSAFTFIELDFIWITNRMTLR